MYILGNWKRNSVQRSRQTECSKHTVFILSGLFLRAPLNNTGSYCNISASLRFSSVKRRGKENVLADFSHIPPVFYTWKHILRYGPNKILKEIHCLTKLIMFQPIITYIIRNEPRASPETFCGLVFQNAYNPDACAYSDARFDWEVTLPERPETVPVS